MSALAELQKDFTSCIAELIIFANDSGLELTFGDAYRDPRVHGEVGRKIGYGHKSSAHKQRLAVDFNLFSSEGDYLTSTLDYEPLGRYWVTLHSHASWGGDFGDGNHFSFKYQGIR